MSQTRRLQFLAGHPPDPRAFGGIAPRKSSNLDQKRLLPHHNEKYHVEYMLCISLYFTGEQNWPNLWIFQTVATAKYFRGPRNSITTALHYGKCQWVFNWPAVSVLESLRGVHFEMTRKCDISSTSLEGINENLLHLISGILFADNLRRQIGHFCKILVICEPLAIAQSLEYRAELRTPHDSWI